MTFIEAVQALKDGRCDGIKRPAWACSMKIDKDILGSGYHITHYLADDWQLVNEKPQVEPVNISKFWCSRCNSMGEEQDYCCGIETIKLTGTLLREVPRKVKRREEIKWEYDQSAGGWVFVLPNGSYTPADAKYFAEWEE